MKQKLRFRGFFLLLIFSQLVLPPCLLHEFTSHHDTHDLSIKTGQSAIDNEHIHCDNQDLFSTGFSKPAAFLDKLDFQTSDMPLLFTIPNKKSLSFCLFLYRAPPAII